MNKSKHVFESLLVLLIVILSIPAVSESNNMIPQASSLQLLSTISLDPTSGPAGTTVTITGSLFLPGSVVTISYDGTAVATTPATITTDLSGGFSATFTVPASTAGSHTVSAKDAASNSASAQFTVTATIPSAPTNLSATAVSPSQINLSWTAPTNNGGSAITGYQIERSTDGGTTWNTIVANTASTTASYSNYFLSASTAYTYRVSAINAIGTGLPSSTASATTSPATVPDSPRYLNATTVPPSQINLSWWTPVNTGGSPITGYKIEKTTDARTTTPITIANTGSASYINHCSNYVLSASTAYTYR